MLYAYIGAVVVVVLLIAFATLAVRWIARSVTGSIRNRTLELISAYDELLEERSRTLGEMDRRIQAQDAPRAAREPESRRNKTTVPAADQNSGTAALSAAERISTAAYRDSSVAEVYQKIRSAFSFSLPEVLKEIPSLEKPVKKGPATRLLEELSGETVCALATLPAEQQRQLLMEELDPEQAALLERYAGQCRVFDSLRFYDFLREEADREPHAPVIRMAPGAAGGCTAPSGMLLVADGDICEGIQVEADNVLYDYSIRAREIV